MKTSRYSKYNEIYHTTVLNNGLKVTIIEKKDFRKKFVCFGTKFGSTTTKFIPLGENKFIEVPCGIAHFLEHKLFEMPDGTDAANNLAELGFDTNAYTSFTETVYLMNGIDNFDEALTNLIDFVQTPYFTDENIEKERGIIEQELLMYLDVPRDRLYYGVLNNMFKSHTIKYDIVGTVDSLKNIEKDALYHCYNTFYHPSNMHLVVIGDVNPNDVLTHIKKNQDNKNFKKQEDIHKMYDVENNQVVFSSNSIKMDIIMPKAAVGLKLPYENFKKNELLQLELELKVLLESVIGSSTSAYQEMLDLEYILSGYSYEVYVGETCGFIMVSSDTNKPNEFVDYITKKLLGLSENTITVDTFERYRKAILGSFIKVLNNLETVALNYLEYSAKNCCFYDAIEIVQKMKLKNIKKLDKYFVSNAITNFVINPNK